MQRLISYQQPPVGALSSLSLLSSVAATSSELSTIDAKYICTHTTHTCVMRPSTYALPYMYTFHLMVSTLFRAQHMQTSLMRPMHMHVMAVVME